MRVQKGPCKYVCADVVAKTLLYLELAGLVTTIASDLRSDWQLFDLRCSTSDALVHVSRKLKHTERVFGKTRDHYLYVAGSCYVLRLRA